MIHTTITVVYTEENQEVQYTNGNSGYEDVSYRKVIENGDVSEPMRIREWEITDDGAFHSSLPKWIIYGAREWTKVYTGDNSPPPKELQEQVAWTEQ